MVRRSAVCRPRAAVAHAAALAAPVPAVWPRRVQRQRAQGHVSAGPVAGQPADAAALAGGTPPQWLQLPCGLDDVRDDGGILRLDALKVLCHELVDGDVPPAGRTGRRASGLRRVGYAERQERRRRARQREGNVVCQLAAEEIAEGVVESDALKPID